jgi:polyphosphate kinase 2 (PPK2 family)
VKGSELEATRWRPRTARSAARNTRKHCANSRWSCALQDWIRQEGERIVVVFEGRDVAGDPIEAHTLGAFA